MQIVIEIDKETYKKCKWKNNGVVGMEWWERAIVNGTPLPKGHGRLIDADNLFNEFCEIAVEPYINASTVLEADMRGDTDADSN